jgi:hypothetical protein
MTIIEGNGACDFLHKPGSRKQPSPLTRAALTSLRFANNAPSGDTVRRLLRPDDVPRSEQSYQDEQDERCFHVEMIRTTSRMFKPALCASKIIIVSSDIVVTAILIVLVSEAEFLLAKIWWHRKFEQELLRNGEVRLADLVNFKWDMIYLLESYSTLDTEQEAKLFPATSWSDPFCWRGDVRYWTIAYQRPGTSPFLIKFQKKRVEPEGIDKWCHHRPGRQIEGGASRYRRIDLLHSTACPMSCSRGLEEQNSNRTTEQNSN